MNRIAARVPQPHVGPRINPLRWYGCVVVGEHHWNPSHDRCLYCGRKATS